MATDREIAETVHGMNETKQAFRLIVVRWPNPQPSLFEADAYCYHAVISNRAEAESASEDRKSTRLNSSHSRASRMPSSA